MGKKIAVTDHLGNNYDSITEMCKAYDIGTRLYCDRISRGFSIKQALGKEKKTSSLHSIVELATENGVSREHIEIGRSLGLTLQEMILLSKGKLYIDHTGIAYTSFNKMCKDWGQNASTVRSRLKRGLTIEQALES